MNKDRNERPKIFIVSDKNTAYNSLLKEELKDYSLKIFDSFDHAYYSVYASPPQLIIITMNALSKIGSENNKREIKMITDMQLDNMLSNIPVLFMLPAHFDFNEIKDEKYFLKDYIKEPLNPCELRYKTQNIIYASKSALDANPLTKLPGNSSIMESVKDKLVGEVDFSFAYIDIDNFKSYNDKYGFLRGDEVIMMTSRLIATTVYDISKTRKREINQHVFIGHIGGDDFVFMSHPDDIIDISNAIISNFDKIILSFYDNTDKQRGYIEAYDRQKKMQKFPVMSLSIAVIEDVNKKISHYGQISEIASGLKSTAKEKKGSNVIVDRRRVE